MYEFNFPNFPEWAISMTRIVPIFYTTDDRNIDNISFTYNFEYCWRKTNNGYVLQVFVFFYCDDETANVFLDLNAYISNEKNYSEY
jgi:hypothetical protein